MALPLIVIGPLQGFRMMDLGGSAFTTRQVGPLPAFRAEVVGVPFGGGALSRPVLPSQKVPRDAPWLVPTRRNAKHGSGFSRARVSGGNGAGV